MIRLMTGQDMASFEKQLFQKSSDSNIQEKLLHHVCDQIFHHVTRQRLREETNIIFLVGPGNNGADALRICQMFAEKTSFKPTVIEVFAGKSDLRIKKLNELKKTAAGKVRFFNSHSYAEFFKVSNDSNNIIFDGIFGAGLSKDLDATTVKIIQAANALPGYKIAIDIPTGLDSFDGNLLPVAFKADMTFTNWRPKPGFYVNEGPRFTGKIKLLNFDGFAEKQNGFGQRFVFTTKDAKKYFPARSTTQNKTNFGKLLVIAGSKGMEGAACLAGLAAARIGVGYVTVCSPAKNIRTMMSPDFLWQDFATLEKQDLTKYSAIIFGPGIGRGPHSKKALKLIANHPNVICDADGLFALAENPKLKIPATWILTPHAGELARLIDMPAKEIEQHRWTAGQKAVEKFGCHILLKGFHTTVSFQGKYSIRQGVITTGNVALAKAGTGDVLTGFVGSLKAQGFPSWKAALTAASYHGFLADQWVRQGKGNWSLMASDLLKD